MKKRCLILGASGFVGSNVSRHLLNMGYSVDLADKNPSENVLDPIVQRVDLRDRVDAKDVLACGYDEIYQCAAMVGGVGFSGTGRHDADILRDSILINANILNAILEIGKPYPKIFFSSSATVYPGDKEGDMSEDMAYPVNPSSEYGWEKILSERLYFAHYRNYGIPIRIARFHNIFGAPCVYRGGRETSIASFCRMVAEAPNGGSIKIWGDGSSRRSYLHIDDCVRGVIALMESDVIRPVNIGSDLSVSIRTVCNMLIELSGKSIKIETVPGPSGAQNRNSDNSLAYSRLNWKPDFSLINLEKKLTETYQWIERSIKNEGK